jgi:hypothetical protein
MGAGFFAVASCRASKLSVTRGVMAALRTELAAD